MKYTTKPVTIEAEKFIRSNLAKVREFCPVLIGISTPRCPDGKMMGHIETLEGVMTATEGDYIIKGLKGEFYPCKPDVFNQKYEPLKD